MSNPVLWEKYEKYFHMSSVENFTHSAKRDLNINQFIPSELY